MGLIKTMLINEETTYRWSTLTVGRLWLLGRGGKSASKGHRSNYTYHADCDDQRTTGQFNHIMIVIIMLIIMIFTGPQVNFSILLFHR